MECLLNGGVHQFELYSQMTIGDVKLHIQKWTDLGIPAYLQTLFFLGDELEDDERTLGSYNIHTKDFQRGRDRSEYATLDVDKRKEKKSVKKNDELMTSFVCPITQFQMSDPVTCMDGHTYERSGIEHWLEDHDTSPLTGAKLPSKNLIPNHALRNAIDEWKKL